MTDNVIPFPIRAPEPDEEMLCSVQLYRCGFTGRVKGFVLDMPPAVIEANGRDVPERLRIIAKWLQAAGRDMRAVSYLFEG